MIVVICRKLSLKWKTIGRKSIGFYLRSFAKAFGSTSEKNIMSWIGGRFEFWFCSFVMGKDWLALPQEKYQKLFKVIIKAFEALSFLMLFLQKSEKMLVFCFCSTWEKLLGLWDTFCTWSIIFFRHNLFLIHRLPTKFQILIASGVSQQAYTTKLRKKTLNYFWGG